MAWNLVVQNGVLQLHDPGPAAAFLRSQPPGVYTTTRTIDDATSLLLWDRHLARLAQSIKLFSKAHPRFLPSDRIRLTDFGKHLQFMLQPSLKMGIERAMELRRKNEELLLTAYIINSTLTDEPQESKRCNEYEGYVVHVHVSGHIPDQSECVKHNVAVMGPGRKVPNVKHSEWVRTRQALEQCRPKDATEVVLSDDGDLLLEGMVSNLFVLVSRKAGLVDSGAHPVDAEGTRSWQDVVLQTAPLTGVLPGVIRQLVLEACLDQGIDFEEVAPSWKEHHLWKEAFITNSVRLVQSVETIQHPVNWISINNFESWQNATWEHLHLQAPGMFTELIQGLVKDKCKMYSMSIDSLLKA